jgi:fructose-bisphosphate aldolase class II
MALVNMGDMLGHAYRHAYAVGAFGVVTLEFLEAVIQAAENCRSPVILNQTESRFENYDFELMMPAIITAARRATVPVAVNFDHGSNLASAEKAIRSGCNGVMVDTSMMTLSENLWLTRDLVTKAHASGVSVEGVIGYVPGADGENIRYYPGKLLYTSATEAKGFIERTGVDCLSVSIGTVHGRMKGLPKLDYARLSKIKEATGIPLVMGGADYLMINSDDSFAMAWQK